MSNPINNGPAPTPTASIQPVSPGVQGPNPFYYLSPASLMAYIEQELQHIDTGINKELNAIRGKNDLAQKLSESTAYLEKMKGLQGKPGGNEYYKKAFGVCSDGKLAVKAQHPNSPFFLPTQGPDPEAKASHEAAMKTLQETADGLRAEGYEEQALQVEAAMQKLDDGYLTDGMSQVQAALESIKSVGDGLGRSNQLSMINLQQSMELRSRALTFVSNALKAMDAPADQAVRNMV
jgi:hypothetical protein